MKKIILIIFSFLIVSYAHVVKAVDTTEPAILMIGASTVDARTPFNDEMIPALGGISVANGSFLSLGNALVRNRKLPGFIINEAQAGATTFDRRDCIPGPDCGPAFWLGYDKQFTRALTYVTMSDPENPGHVIYNADYVVIIKANDCMHSAAFDMPQDQATLCSLEEVNGYIDRLISVGQRALDAGITPIYDVFPRWDDLDIDKPAFGLLWRIDEFGYNEMRNLHMTRIAEEMPEAILLDMWKGFVPMADGLHPNYKTAKKAAARIAKAIIKDRVEKSASVN
jgi:hypothetical protein